MYPFCAAKIMHQKQSALAQLASEAAQLLEADRKMLEAALQGLQDPTDPNKSMSSKQEQAVRDGITNPKILKHPSGEALPLIEGGQNLQVRTTHLYRLL